MKVFLISVGFYKRVVKRLILITSIALVIATVGIIFEDALVNSIEASAPVKNDDLVIILDAGHGGEDVGATGVTGVFEKDLNLEVTFIIGELLINEGYTVVYTRNTDRLLYTEEQNIKGLRKISDLKNRCNIGNSYENAIFVSIHMNTFGASKYSGLQVYYANERDDSERLARFIQSEVKKSVQTENKRQVKNGKDLYLLDNCNATSVLVECGFLSNQEECEKLSQKEYQKELSFSIVCGIIEYIKSISLTQST